MRSNARKLSGRPGASETVVMVLFAALSLWMVALSLWQVVRTDAVWTGTDGLFTQDQLQYLAWITDSSNHLLSSNLFVIPPQPHNFLQPAVALSAVLVALGVAPWLALLLWKPVAVVALLIAVYALVRRAVEGTLARAVALALGLLFTGWGALVASWVGQSDDVRWVATTNESSLVFWSWGYYFGVLAFAAALAALLVYASRRDRPGLDVAAPILAALASWLHPWQGEILILILLCSEAVQPRLRRPLRVQPLATTIGAAALPILYYLILTHSDENWEVAQKSAHAIRPLWIALLTLAPLALPALLAYRIRPATFLDVAIRVWCPAGLVVFLLAQTPRASGALHALLGLSVPLAVLAVQGLRMSLGRVPAGIVAGGVVVVLAPPLIDRLDNAHEIVRESLRVRPDGSRVSARFIDPGERQALDWLRDEPREGGVMAPAYLGALVPGRTGRSTYVGNSYWSGGNVAFLFASGAVSSLLTGALSQEDSRALVRSSGARFIFAGCGRHVDLERRLPGSVTRARRFDCADVFIVN